MTEGEMIKALKEALIWCSGSNDFGPGGKAHEGWVKTCRPLLYDFAPDLVIPTRKERTMAPCQVTEPQRQPLVTEAVMKIASATEHLDKVVASLETRLTPVLSAIEKNCTADKELVPINAHVPLYGSLKDLATRIERAAQYLSALKDRLEV
jgi:hypothetical protein